MAALASLAGLMVKAAAATITPDARTKSPRFVIIHPSFTTLLTPPTCRDLKMRRPQAISPSVHWEDRAYPRAPRQWSRPSTLPPPPLPHRPQFAPHLTPPPPSPH